jgi:hypothetical protein
MIQNTRWSLEHKNAAPAIVICMVMKQKHTSVGAGKMQWIMPFVGFDWRYRRGSGRNGRKSFENLVQKINVVFFSVGYIEVCNADANQSAN